MKNILSRNSVQGLLLTGMLCALATDSFAAGLSATATFTAVQSGSSYQYSITLTNTGTTTIGTFWFAWVPGAGFLTVPPTGVQSPTNWNGALMDGNASIQWTTANALLGPGQSLAGFTFSSTESPAELLGTGSGGGGTQTTSFVYIGAPLGDPGFQFNATQASTTTANPTITLVANAFGDTPLIAPNTWVEIKGTGLVSSSTPSTGVDWSNASSFASGQMPTELNSISVTVNGNPAYMYFTCSAVTDPSCPLDQINILTPPDAMSGSVPVQVTTGGTESNTFNVQAAAQSLSFFDFVSASGKDYVYGRHNTTGALIGPAGLFPTAPNLTTPAQPGETIIVAGNGFGTTSVPVVSGAVTQSGDLPQPWPVIQIGGIPATVTFAGLAGVGTYQFNIVVPQNVPDGDLPLTATYNGLSTQPNLLITIQSSNPPTVQSLALAATSITGGGTVQGTITMSAPAPSGGMVVSLSSSSNTVTVPSTVTVPAGSSSANFTISTSNPSSNQTATITVSYGGNSAQASLTVTAVQTNNPPTVQSLALSISYVTGGGSVQGTVTMSAAAPSGGITVALSSNSSGASVPSTVLVPAGSTSVSFTISTSDVSSAEIATITASYNGSSAQATLQITPSGSYTPPGGSYSH